MWVSRKIVKAALAQGWELGFTAKGHLRWVPPDPNAAIVHAPGTPGDRRAEQNFLAQLKRSGFLWPVK